MNCNQTRGAGAGYAMTDESLARPFLRAPVLYLYPCNRSEKIEPSRKSSMSLVTLSLLAVADALVGFASAKSVRICKEILLARRVITTGRHLAIIIAVGERGV